MIKLYNSLSRKIEIFTPINPPKVNMYTCGPTVYNFAHIGNFRTYTTADLLYRTLKYNSYDVNYVMNLTDVGHLTGDNLGDADFGEDRMEKAAKKEGKTAWDIAEFYANVFIEDFKALNLEKPMVFAKVTEHIPEQIELIRRLEEKGYTYITSDGVYFDTSKFKDYGKLSDLDQIKDGARVEINEEKKNPRDFALWKFSPKNEKRQMEWKSPWGMGFPGWHIECSALSMKYLGDMLDIHCGGVDLKQTHHPNEIAQAEAVTRKQFVKYWVHTAFMLVQGERMSKSLGNNYNLYDLVKQGYNPLALRYLYLQTHYRQEMNFTFQGLDAATTAYKKLLSEVASWGKPSGRVIEIEEEFLEAINEDLNLPKALSIVWKLVKSANSPSEKAGAILRMDSVLGLDIEKGSSMIAVNNQIIPEKVKVLLKERNALRKNRKFNDADRIRKQIEELGFEIEDTKKGTRVIKKT